jgi:hypothetical protein
MKVAFDSLKVGVQYHFDFTHKKSIHGLVCEVDQKRERIVVYNMNSKEYEGIPVHRFLSAEK